MIETSQKIRKQIAREDDDLMTIATDPTKYMHDDSIYQYYNAEVKARAIGYGDGKEDGRRDEKIEIAKSILKESPELGLEKIAKITGLTIENLDELKNEMTQKNN